MRRIPVLLAILAALMLSSCTQTQTGGEAESGDQHATVIMRDGTKTAGFVTESSSSEITIKGDDNITRTIPMTQVRSIEYDDASAMPAEAEVVEPAEESAPAAERKPVTSGRRPATRPSPAPVAKTVQPAPPATPEPPAPAPRPAPRTYEIPSGAQILVRTLEAIDSSKTEEGQVYEGEISQDVLDDSGKMVIPKRSSAQIEIISASQGGRIRGASDLVVNLKSVFIGGRSYSVATEAVAQRGREGVGANRRTAEFTGGGAAIGAIVGAIAGGGKGAAIGAASGAGAGALTQILTKGKSIKIPAETVLTFRLDETLRVTED